MSSYMPFQPRYRGGSPFGLGGHGLGGLFGQQPNTGVGYAARPVITPPPHRPQIAPPAAALVGAYRGYPTASAANTAPTAKATDSYDIATDPAYQQAQALVGLSDQQATAAAQKQIKDLLLAYGDPNLVTRVLGSGDLAKAAAGNPTSTVAQLNDQRGRNLKSLDDQLNAANLSYSGYRVDQEKQAAQDYQNALAQAAAGVQGQLGQIQSALQQALGANQWNLAQAAQQAYQNGVGAGYDPGYSGYGAAPGGSSVYDWVGQLFRTPGMAALAGG